MSSSPPQIKGKSYTYIEVGVLHRIPFHTIPCHAIPYHSVWWVGGNENAGRGGRSRLIALAAYFFIWCLAWSNLRMCSCLWILPLMCAVYSSAIKNHKICIKRIGNCDWSPERNGLEYGNGNGNEAIKCRRWQLERNCRRQLRGIHLMVARADDLWWHRRVTLDLKKGLYHGSTRKWSNQKKKCRKLWHVNAYPSLQVHIIFLSH